MTPHIMVKKAQKPQAFLLEEALTKIGFIHTGETGNWLIYSLRYMNCIVKCWVNKKEEYSIQFEVLE